MPIYELLRLRGAYTHTGVQPMQSKHDLDRAVSTLSDADSSLMDALNAYHMDNHQVERLEEAHNLVTETLDELQTERDLMGVPWGDIVHDLQSLHSTLDEIGATLNTRLGDDWPSALDDFRQSFDEAHQELGDMADRAGELENKYGNGDRGY